MVWEIFESTTESISDASEVRVSYHLGKGNSSMAKLSAFKSMYLSGMLSFIGTGVFWYFRNDLPEYLTDDPTLQAMLVELFPLIAMGNITMNVGMCCWTLVGAQGRYKLATSINTASTLLVTLPLAALFTVYLRIDLQGLTFAVVTGYTVTAMALTTTLLMSNWEKLAAKIQTKMAAEEEDSSDDESAVSKSTDSTASLKSDADKLLPDKDPTTLLDVADFG